MDSVTLSNAHSKEKGGEKGKQVNEKTSKVLGSADTIIHTDEEGPTVQLCGDSETGKWIHDQYSLRQKYRGRISQIQKNCTRCGKGKSSILSRRMMTTWNTPSEKTIRRLITESTWGIEGQRKIIVDKSNITETWKAVKVFWDGSAKDNDKSGCGVLIKVVDRDRWVTIKKLRYRCKLIRSWQSK